MNREQLNKFARELWPLLFFIGGALCGALMQGACPS